MSNASVWPAAPVSPLAIIRDLPAAEPMPETKTRRTIKLSKAHIKRLRRQVKAEEQRIALQRELYALSDKLDELRKK